MADNNPFSQGFTSVPSVSFEDSQGNVSQGAARGASFNIDRTDSLGNPFVEEALFTDNPGVQVAGTNQLNNFIGQPLQEGEINPNQLNDFTEIPGSPSEGGRSLGEILFGSFDEESRKIQGGVFTPITKAAVGIGNVALGFRQVKQSERALDLQRDQFNRNFAMQTEMINRRLEDRERARLLLQGKSSGEAEQGAKRYVEQFGVKDKGGK